IPPFFKEAIEVSFGQPGPFSIGQTSVLQNWITSYRQVGCDNNFSSVISNSKVKINIHIIWKAITLIEETGFLYQPTLKSHSDQIYRLTIQTLARLDVTKII